MTSVETQCPKEGKELLGQMSWEHYSASTARGECLTPGSPQQGQVYRMQQSDPDLLVWLVPMLAGTMGPRKISSKWGIDREAFWEME